MRLDTRKYKSIIMKILLIEINFPIIYIVNVIAEPMYFKLNK